MHLNETILEVGVKKIQSRTLKCILFSIFLPYGTTAQTIAIDAQHSNSNSYELLIELLLPVLILMLIAELGLIIFGIVCNISTCCKLFAIKQLPEFIQNFLPIHSEKSPEE